MKPIRIGTRGSPLALRQAEIVRSELARVRPGLATEIVIIKTSGDWTPEQGEGPLDRDGGGKALFAKELEEALLEGRIDAAVHSMKDMDSNLPEGLVIGAMLPREDVRDAVILKNKNKDIKRLADLPAGFRIGTCSVRRQGFLLAANPGLEIVSIRGNIGTRLEKLQAGELAGIVLATAGLNRLNMVKNVSFIVPESEMIPSAGQGAMGIEIKQKNSEIMTIISQINHPETLNRVNCERAVLAELGAGCRTPIGVHAVLVGDQLSVRACLISPDGKERWEEEASAPLAAAINLGRVIGIKLKSRAPEELLQ